MQEILKGEQMIELMLQFLKENKLEKTYKALQEESEIRTNFLHNVETFKRNMFEGKWEFVLQELETLELPRRVLMDFYETLMFELFDNEEWDLARYVWKDVLTQRSKAIFQHFRKD